MNAVLELNGVTRVHQDGNREVKALDNVSLNLHQGELVAVMGPSGSGKTTLLNLAGGLDTPTHGSIVVESAALSSLDARGRAALRRRHIGYVFQDFNLVPALTAAENVALPLELDGMRPRRSRRRALDALAEVGLEGLAQRFPDELSGGQSQRVAIARALIGPRRLILADEPTGALDSSTGEAVMKVLRARIEAGAAGLLVTHEPRFAAWADRVIFLRDGRIIDATERDTPEVLLARRP